MMKREGSVRTLEIIKECAETAGGYKISLEQAERAMETEQLERIADALEGISGHLSRLTSCIGSSCGSRMLTRKNTDSALQRSKTTNRAAALPETVTRGRRTAAG